jgi:sigma54-dependent transcription regulator
MAGGVIREIESRHHAATKEYNSTFTIYCVGLLAGDLLQTVPKHRSQPGDRAREQIDGIDLNLSRYDRLATRFAKEQTLA